MRLASSVAATASKSPQAIRASSRSAGPIVGNGIPQDGSSGETGLTWCSPSSNHCISIQLENQAAFEVPSMRVFSVEQYRPAAAFAALTRLGSTHPIFLDSVYTFAADSI